MVERMLALSGQLKALAELFDASGIDHALFGFTTLGWHGGPTRYAWLETGAKAYPGRVCALLHVRYKDFGTAMPDDAWRELVDPAHFFENVDGEALQWAWRGLAERPHPLKVLIVISDGAPVDDATLSANGPGILDRHLREVIAAIESDEEVLLGAVGIDYRVSELYAHSAGPVESDDFIDSLAPLLMQMLDETG